MRNLLCRIFFSELSYFLKIVNTNKSKLYLDARQWLEHYASTHGDHSPMDGTMTLPSGRKYFYYRLYVESAKRSGVEPASMAVFLKMWRTVCPSGAGQALGLVWGVLTRRYGSVCESLVWVLVAVWRPVWMQ